MHTSFGEGNFEDKVGGLEIPDGDEFIQTGNGDEAEGVQGYYVDDVVVDFFVLDFVLP